MKLPGIVLISVLMAQAVLAEEPEKWALMQRAVLVEQDAGKIRALVGDGVNPSDPIGCGTFAPLDGAITKENPELVELLLSLGAKPRDSQIVVAAFAANHDAGLKMVKLLRTAGLSVNARDYYARTALHSAVWRENVELVQYLLGEPDIHLNELNVDGYTPLMTAIRQGNSEIFDMLLAAGANPAVRNARGLDAAGVAEGVIAQHKSFVEKLQPRLSAR